MDISPRSDDYNPDEEQELVTQSNNDMPFFDSDAAEDAVAGGSGADFSLDNLLEESLQAVSREKAAKEARKRLAKGNLGDAEKAEIQATVDKWELERVWEAQASVLMFHQQTCTHCGSTHSHFVGCFQRQSHRTSKIERWQRMDSAQMMTSQLPLEKKVDDCQVAICINCLGGMMK